MADQAKASSGSEGQTQTAHGTDQHDGSTSVALQYPTIGGLNHSLADIVSWSQETIKMTDALQHERPGSSLDRDWQSVDSADLTSEDDIHSVQTDALSSTGDQHTDDMSSTDGGYLSSDAEEGGGEYQGVSSANSNVDQIEASGVRTPDTQLEDAVGDGENNDVPDFGELSDQMRSRQGVDGDVVSAEVEEMEDDYTQDAIVFKGIGVLLPGTAKGACTYSHKLVSFSGRKHQGTVSEQPLVDATPIDVLTFLLVTMQKESFNPHTPYHIVYAGHESLKTRVLSKLGDALLAGAESPGSSSPSRFQVVPTSSFGPGISPLSELHEIGLQMEVEDVVNCSTLMSTSMTKDIMLDFSNGLFVHSNRSRSEGIEKWQYKASQEWKLPNLAVLLSSENDDRHMKEVLQQTQNFMLRHHVPCLILSEEPMFDTTALQSSPLLKIDRRMPHVLVHTHPNLTGASDCFHPHRRTRMFPTDLETFERIDSTQLNRALAYLNSDKATPRAFPMNEVPEQEESLNYDESATKSPSLLRHLGELDVPRLYWQVMMVLTTLLIGIILQVLFTSPVSQSRDQKIGPAVSSTSAWPSASSTPTTSVRIAVPVQSPVPQVSSSIPKGVSMVGRSDLVLSPTVAALNHSDRFEIHVVGESHIIVKPPKQMITTRKPPKFSVKVTRHDGKVLDYNLAKLFDGVYGLRLDRLDAFGAANVTISSKVKPIFEQTFEVDFGNSWLHVASWRKAAQDVSANFYGDVRKVGVNLNYLVHNATARQEILQKNIQEVKDLVVRSKELPNQVYDQCLANERCAALSSHASSALQTVSSRALAIRQDIDLKKVRQNLAHKVSKMHKSRSLAKLQWKTKRLLGIPPPDEAIVVDKQPQKVDRSRLKSFSRLSRART